MLILNHLICAESLFRVMLKNDCIHNGCGCCRTCEEASFHISLVIVHVIQSGTSQISDVLLELGKLGKQLVS